MKRVVPMTEQFQHFLAEVKESFWGDLYGRTRTMWKEFFEEQSQRDRDRYMGLGWHDRSTQRADYRNGFYERDWVTRFGTLRLRIARTRGKNFLPKGLENFQRRAEEVTLLIREAFLRGISTRQVGKVVAIVTGEPVSATTVSKVTKSLDTVVRQFRRARLQDEWVYLFLDGVSLRVRRAAGRQRVQMLVAYGVKADGSRQLLGFVRSQGESQTAWEGLLNDLHGRGLTGENLQLVVTDGCAGLAAALATVYPHVAHQRCWVHKMRNILKKVKKADRQAVKQDAQAIYLADSRSEATAAFRHFKQCWQAAYPQQVKSLQKDLPELLAFFSFPKQLRKKLRTTNVIERCFVEVRRRTRPMVCFVNMASVDRIILSIFNRFDPQWKNRTLNLFTQAA